MDGETHDPLCEERVLIVAECQEIISDRIPTGGYLMRIIIEWALMEGGYILNQFEGEEAILQLKGPYRPLEGRCFAVVAMYMGWKTYHNEIGNWKVLSGPRKRVRKFKSHVRDFIQLDLRSQGRFPVHFMHLSKRVLSSRLEEGLEELSSSFLRAILLGDRYALSYSERDVLRRAGAYHVLAISGIHIGLLSMIFLTAYGALGLSREASSRLTMLILFFYVALVGGSPSAVRAFIMVSIFLGSFYFQRYRSPLNSLAFAAVIILCLSPIKIITPGFLLSFTAVAGILISLRTNRDENDHGRCLFIRRYLIGGVRVSASAFLAQVPVMALFFSTVYPVSLISNLAIIPILAIILPLGLTFLFFSALKLSVAFLLAPAVDTAVTLLFHFAEIFGRVSPLYVNRGHLFDVSLLAYTCLLVVSGRSGKAIAMFLLSLSALLVPLREISNRYGQIPESVRATFLDVGEGDCTILELGSGRCVVIDTGATGSETFPSQLSDYLRTIGVRRVDILVLTHPHDDHFADARELLIGWPVGSVIGISPRWKSDSYARLLQSVQHAGIPYYTADSGDTIVIGSAMISFLNPQSVYQCNPTENDYSIVLRLEINDFSFLFAGDGEICAEEEMIKGPGNGLDCDVLKVGHHGAITSTTREFLDETSPKLAIISCGRADKFHHPSPIILKRFEERGIPVLRTDLHGAIVIEHGPSGSLKVTTSIPAKPPLPLY